MSNFLSKIVFLLIVAIAGSAHGAGYPDKPLSVVVPFAAGASK